MKNFLTEFIREDLFSPKTVRFIVVGGGNTLVSYLAFVLLYIMIGMYLVSTAIAYIIATINSYFLNRMWVFKSNRANSVKAFTEFIFVNLVSLGLNVTVMYVLVDKFYLNVYMAQALVIFIITIVNYTGYKIIFDLRK